MTQSRLTTRAELLKLAALIDRDVEQLQGLEEAGADGLARLRHRIVAQRFDHRRGQFRKLAKLVRFLPSGSLAKIARSALGPRVAGRVVSEMDPVLGARVAKRLPAEFLADAVAHAEPVSVRDIVPNMPPDLIRDVALILIERKAYALMGQFADALAPPAIRAVVNAVNDDAELLHIAFFMENRRQLSRIIYMIDNERVVRIIQAGTEKSLWPEALSVVDNVEDELRTRLINIMAEQDTDTLNDLVGVAHKQQLWGPVLRAITRMSPRYYRKIVNLPAIRDEALLGDLIATAHAENLLEAALPLARPMRVPSQIIVARAALKQGPELAEAALWAAHAGGHWDVVLDLGQHLDEDDKNLIAGLPVLRNPQVIRDLLNEGARGHHIEFMLDVVTRMDEDARRQVGGIALENDGDLLEAVLDAVRMRGSGWPHMATMLAALDSDGRETAARIYARQDEADRSALAEGARAQGLWDTLAPSLEATPA